MKFKISHLIFAVSILSAYVPTASAHEHRLVADQYSFVVGFLNEPAFSGEMNGIDLRVSKAGQPLEGLEKTLKAVVMTPDRKQSMPVLLRTRYKQPGSYAGYFLPAKSGDYVFQISGEIEGRKVSEIFISGPDTFSPVADSAKLRFPAE